MPTSFLPLPLPFSSTNACFHNLHVHSQAVVSLVAHSRAACVKSFLSPCLNWRARRALSWHGVTSAPHTPGHTLTAAKLTGVCPETEEKRCHTGTASHDSEVKQAFQPTSSFFVCFGCYIPFEVMERALQAVHTPEWAAGEGVLPCVVPTGGFSAQSPPQTNTSQPKRALQTVNGPGPVGPEVLLAVRKEVSIDSDSCELQAFESSTSDWLQVCVQRLERMLPASFTSWAC